MAFRRRRSDLEDDAAQPLSWCAAVLLQQHFRRPGESKSTYQRRTHSSMSTDGGRSFHAIATGGGWDYHAIWWSADGRRIVNRMRRRRHPLVRRRRAFLAAVRSAVCATVPRGLGHSRRNYRVCIGLQDDNSWCGPSAPPNGIGVMNRDWYQVVPGDGMWAVIDPQDPGLSGPLRRTRIPAKSICGMLGRSKPTKFRRTPSRTASTQRAR